MAGTSSIQPSASADLLIGPGRAHDPTVRVDRHLLDELATLNDRLLVAHNHLAHGRRGGVPAALVEEFDDVMRRMRAVVRDARAVPVSHTWLRSARWLRDLGRADGSGLHLAAENTERVAVDVEAIAALEGPIASFLETIARGGVDAGAPAPVDAAITIGARLDHDDLVLEIAYVGQAVEIDADLHAVVTERRGSISTTQREGKLRYVVVVPVGRGDIDATLVRCEGSVYGLAAATVTGRFRLDTRRTRIDDVAGAEVVDHDGALVPLIWLRDVLCVEPSPMNRHEVLVLDHAGHRVGLVVDRILHNELVLAQQIGLPLQRWGPFASTAISGSGDVVVMLELADIIATIGLETEERRSFSRRDTTIEVPTTLVEQLAGLTVHGGSDD
ncbi:MAG: chemotaxis protein CheW [Actinomycetota bacterium]